MSRTKCAECACSKFVSTFCCLSCDGKWEEHVTLYEDEQERRELGKPVGEDFYPLADVPDIQAEYIRSDIIPSSGVSAPLSDLVFRQYCQFLNLGFAPIYCCFYVIVFVSFWLKCQASVRRSLQAETSCPQF